MEVRRNLASPGVNFLEFSLLLDPKTACSPILLGEAHSSTLFSVPIDQALRTAQLPLRGLKSAVSIR